MDKPWALVTGATSGIGEALARRLAGDGHPLVLTARRGGELERLAGELKAAHGIAVRIVPLDLGADGAVASLHAACAGVDIGIVVNNAGVGLGGAFATSDWEREEAMIRLNVLAATGLVKRFLPGLRARGGGAVLNVASTAAFQAGPLMAVYYATKAYLLSWSEALADELRGSGITVTALCPGPTRSGFQAAAGIERSRMVNSPLMMDADAVAAIGLRGMRRGRVIVIPGLFNRLGVFATRLLPRSVTRAVVRRVNADG